MKRLFKLILVCALCYPLTLAAVIAAELTWPRDTLPDRAAVIVCLGGSATGPVIGDDSLRRAERCAALYLAGVAPQILFTGIASAPLMADVARAAGVPDTAMTEEAQSRSTLQNALFSGRIIAPEGRVIVVSDAYHLPRSWLAFRVMGFDDVSVAAAAAQAWNMGPLRREVLATWYNFGRAALWKITPWLDLETRERMLI